MPSSGGGTRDGIEFDAGDWRKLIGRLSLLADESFAGQIVGRALYRSAELILHQAKPITPIEFGNLRRSGHLEGPLMTPEGIAMFIVFGGAAAPYAIWVHERLDLHHNPPTQAKFLEKPFVENRNYAKEQLVGEIAKVLAGDFS